MAFCLRAVALAQLALPPEGSEPFAQREIAERGAISALASWLVDPTRGPADIAARALASVGKDNRDTQETISAAGCIAPLIQMLPMPEKEDTPVTQQQQPAPPMPDVVGGRRLMTSRQWATLRTANRMALHLTGSKEAEAQHWAAAALATLAEDNGPNQIHIAIEGAIPRLVALLRNSKLTRPHNSAIRALWRLAGNEDNQLAIAREGAMPLLATMLEDGREQYHELAAAAFEALSRDCTDNQLMLARVGAITPLVHLLGSESDETQHHAKLALLNIASPSPDNRNAVVNPLVSLLNVRNADAQTKAAEALTLLAARSTSNMSALASAGAIPPLVALLGDGRNVSGLQTRAAECLSYLARAGEIKMLIVDAGGVAPMVTMLRSHNTEAQFRASGALSHLASTTSAQLQIADVADSISSLVSLLSSDRRDTAKQAAHCLWHMCGARADNKVAVARAGGLMPLVSLLRQEESAEAQEAAASVLAELAREKGGSKKVIVNLGAMPGLVQCLGHQRDESAHKHAALAIWGVTAESAGVEALISAEGGIRALVAVLGDGGDAQGYAAAALANIAYEPAARNSMLEAGGKEVLYELARGTQPWLRAQAEQILNQIFPPAAGEGGKSVMLGAEKARKALKSKRAPSPRKGKGSSRQQTGAGAASMDKHGVGDHGAASTRPASARNERPPSTQRTRDSASPRPRSREEESFVVSAPSATSGALGKTKAGTQGHVKPPRPKAVKLG